MKTQKGFATIILAIIVGVLAIGGGVYFYLNPRNNETSAEWKTYSNQEFGFSFSYPSEFEIVSDGPKRDDLQFWHILSLANVNIKENPRLTIEVNPDGYGPFFPTKNYSLEEENNSIRIVNKEEIRDTLNDETSDSALLMGNNLAVSNGNRYSFIFSYETNSKDYEVIFDEILSTVKFHSILTQENSNDGDEIIYIQEDSNNEQVSLKTEKIFEYSNLYATKYENDLYLVNIFGFENEYSATGIYHVDLGDDTIKELDTQYIYKENGKLYGLKNYPLFSTKDLTASTTQDTIDDLVSNRLDELSNEIGVEKNDIETIGLGGVPVIHAIVKTEYNTETKEFKLLPNEIAEYPTYDYSKNYYRIGNLKYPTSDFVDMGVIREINTNVKNLFGIEFNYDLDTGILSLNY